MASQIASADIKPTPRTSTANSKLPYNRPPKKLVVKLKKPFVPVIEEEANLHPPESSNNSTVSPFNTNINVESVGLKHEKNEMDGSDDENAMPDCTEDVPYSPIRQSYTPQLMFNPYQNADERHEVASTEILETKYDPSCSYKLDSDALSMNRMNLTDTVERDCNQSYPDHKNEVTVFEISIEDDKDIQSVENDALWEVNKEIKSHVECTLANDLMMPSTSSCGPTSRASTSSSFTSEPAITNSTQNHLPNLDSARGISYRLPTFHRNDEDYICTGHNQLSHLESDASTSNPHFGSKYKYTSLELDKKTTYMNTDRCKNAERAPSTDSLNIITDEKMPAKGEISEQESNGDIESSWSHQVSIPCGFRSGTCPNKGNYG